MKAKQRNTLRHIFAQPFWQRKGISIWEALRAASSSQAMRDREKVRYGQPLEQNP